MASFTSFTILAASAASGNRLLRQLLLLHLAHECDAGQVLAQAVMQVLPDPPLFAGTDFQDRLLQPLALGDIDSGGDDVRWAASWHRAAPCPTTRSGAGPHPRVTQWLSYPRGSCPRRICSKMRAEALGFIRHVKSSQTYLIADLRKRVSRCPLAGAIEAHDASRRVQNDHQRTHRIENRGDDVALLL